MRRFIFFLVTSLLLAACSRTAAPPVPSTTAATDPTAPPETAVAVEPTATASAAPSPTADDTIPSPTPAVTPTWAAPIEPISPFEQTAVSPAEQEAATELAQSDPPERNDVALAIAYRGVVPVFDDDPPPVTAPLEVGATQMLTIANIDDNTVSQIEAALLAVGEHAYFWFDTGPGSVQPAAEELSGIVTAFDNIYETNVANFGPEANPGIDGDPRLHIVHASPLALCSVTLSTADNCGLAGYFTAANVLPQTVDPNSNEREMFVMNARKFGSSFYLNVLGHELRHMIEDNHDKGDADWEAEGSAVLAEELLGYPGSGQQRGNQFLQNPDQQLNSWTDGNTLPYYGQGYVLNRYIYDRLGPKLYREFVTSPAYGLKGVDAVAVANGLALSGQELWRDWLAALAIHNEPGAAERYRFQGAPLDTVAMTAVDDKQASFETTVHQYAADYYRLPNGPATVSFQGYGLVPILDTIPISGERMWYAQRANYSNPRLTRTVDLTGVDAATLLYAVYVDIEEGYDFAYVSVSTDNGRTWQGLIAENMQGLEPAHDPSGSALTDRFYTGEQRAWFQEAIDLTPYAGQEIQIRFEYVTDLILTYGGLALDNIAIPEIGFYDDAETLDPGWEAEGFVRTTAYLPQQWHLQLVTFPDGAPVVTSLGLDADQGLSFTVEEEGEKRPILIVAASAPRTLEPAHYRLQIEGQ